VRTWNGQRGTGAPREKTVMRDGIRPKRKEIENKDKELKIKEEQHGKLQNT
jgi:hypothetical protein